MPMSMSMSIQTIKNKYGKEVFDVTYLRTGSLGADYAMGGGFPLGRFSEVYGEPSSGKTALCLSTIVQAQKEGIACAFIDAERTFHKGHAEKMGVDMNKLIVTKPVFGEEGLADIENLANEGVKLIIVDSVAALVPKDELEGDMGQAHMAKQARLMGTGLRKLVSLIDEKQVAVVFINQLRSKVGLVFGSPDTTPGGRALGFFTSLRVQVKKVATIQRGDDTIGVRCRVEVKKNKTANPYNQSEFELYFEYGISLEAEVLSLIGDEALEYGKNIDAQIYYLRNNPEELNKLLCNLKN